MPHVRLRWSRASAWASRATTVPAIQPSRAPRATRVSMARMLGSTVPRVMLMLWIAVRTRSRQKSVMVVPSLIVAHSLTAPATRPRTRKRCSAMTITTGGRLASIDAAAISPHGTSKTPGNNASATGIVRLASETERAHQEIERAHRRDLGKCRARDDRQQQQTLAWERQPRHGVRGGHARREREERRERGNPEAVAERPRHQALGDHDLIVREG